MTEKLFLLSLIVISFIIQSCTLNQSVKGDGNVTSKEYPITEYAHIDLTGSKQLFFEQKEGKPSLRIETDSNLFKFIEVKINDKTLNIETKENINPSIFRIYTNSAELASIFLAGSGEIELGKEVKSDDLKISLAGSGKISATKLTCNQLRVSITGSGNITLNNITTSNLISDFSGSAEGVYNGKTENAHLSVSGSGSLNAFSLDAKIVKSDIKGSGEVSLSASEILDASVSGSGTVKYKGAAKISQNISGSGKIIKQ